MAGRTGPETAKILKQWGEKDWRLRIERLSANLGVSENSNRAFAMATGELLACVDHDDLLAPFALFEIARAAIRSPQADIFYSDEDRCTIEGKRHSPFFKPEWNPELLLSSISLGHLTAYRRELVERVGGFRKQFELSQDYDLALRATERAKAIRHVPHVLYHWREHPASGSSGGKPEARKRIWPLCPLPWSAAVCRRKSSSIRRPIAPRLKISMAQGLSSYSDRFCGARSTLHGAAAAHDLLPGLRNCDRDEQHTSESAASGRA
jgi:glycosyltransferase involved in cell wall biosynthesis